MSLEERALFRINPDLECPSMLPIPKNFEEYNARLESYDEGKEDRKTDFLRKSINGYRAARRQYINAIRYIYYVTEGFKVYQELMRFVPDYRRWLHIWTFKRIIISLRKIAECDYYLGMFEEGLEVAKRTIEIHDFFAKFCMETRVDNPETPYGYDPTEQPRMLGLTYGVMARIYMEMNDVENARKSINIGLIAKPTSEFVRRVNLEVEKMETGIQFESERKAVFRNFIYWVSQETEIQERDLFPIRLPKVICEDWTDHYLGERIEYIYSEELVGTVNKEEMFIDIKCSSTNISSSHFSIWKTLFWGGK